MPRAKHQQATEDDTQDTPDEVTLPDRESDDWVEVLPARALMGDTARALLDKAAELGYDAHRAVVSIGHGFRVPQALLDATDLPTEPTTSDRGWHPTPMAALEQGATAVATDAPQ